MRALRKLLLVPVAAGAVLAGGDAGAQAPTTEAVLQPGDAIRIEVWRQPELSGTFDITRDGTIAHPIFRGLRVAGQPQERIEATIGEFLLRFDAEPNYVVDMMFRIPVSGEVRTPGLFEFTPQTTVAQAIGTAGGATSTGRLDRIVLDRGGVQIAVDLTDPDARLREQTLRSGDQIIVPRRVNVFREYIAPAGSITSALVSLVALLVRAI